MAAKLVVPERWIFLSPYVVHRRVTLGNNRHWLMHLFDPDGTRSEFTETAVHSDLQPWTVMAPGPPAPNIVPTTPGVPAWPSSPDDLKSK